MSISDITAKLIFPPRCIACRTLLPYDGEGGETVFCRGCRGAWETAKLSACPDCGLAVMDCRCLPRLPGEAGCAGLVRLAAYDAGDWGGVVNSTVNNLKRRRDREAFDFFASQLTPLIRRVFSDAGIDVRDAIITYCPRRISARMREGFDQSEELARGLAKLCGAQFAPLIKRRSFVYSEEQKRLEARDRYENARRSMKPASNAGAAEGRVVLIVDDIVTTGASIAACADILRTAGAGQIFAACIASVTP